MPTSETVHDVTEVTGSSSESWEQAARAAVYEASQTSTGPLVADVMRQDVVVDDDGGVHFRVTLAVSSEIDLRDEGGSDADTKRFLIVANQTLASAGLEHLVHEKAARGPCRFHVVVPQVSTSTVHVDPSGLFETHVEAAASADFQAARGEAENRLQTFRQLFEENHEAELTGEVVAGDPLQAVRMMMKRTRFDEVIVSTLPLGVSKWLHMDLPHRIQRAVDVPVTSLVQDFEMA